MATAPHILWVDDEIDLLKPHILLLETKGYDVDSVSNGSDAVEKVKDRAYDIILLDEQMPGMGGLDTLAAIKDASPEVPVVMVTKSEEEDLMEEALGGQISDYLTKPVNPSQILLTCKRLLERSRLQSEKTSQRYMQRFAQISQELNRPLSHTEWIDVYTELMRYDIELEGDEGARQILNDQFAEANRTFGAYIEREYPYWIEAADDGDTEDRPVLSHEIIPTYVAPQMKKDHPVIFFLIDCMRYDQWLAFEEILFPYFAMEKTFHYGILPTATPYARNAIFSGMLPRDIAARHPRIWEEGEDDEHSRNRHEAEFLEQLMKREFRGEVRTRYSKLIGKEQGQEFAGNVGALLQHDLSAVVINFVDILAHSRSESDVLKELAPDERAYRALTRTWFEHSWLLEAFKELSEKDCTIVLTTDHGIIRSLHPTKVIGDRHTSTALRYKYGRNLKADERHAIFVEDPESFGLPKTSMMTNYIIAKEDYYFVYPTNYHKYVDLYNDTLQHGGASMEEMILPVVTMTPKG